MFKNASNHSIIIYTLLVFSLFFVSCNRTISKEDVEAQASDAKKQIEKAKEETQKAFEVKHEYLQQEKDKLTSRLEERVDELNSELTRLRSVADQSGEIAINDVNAAIEKVEGERRRVEEQLVEIKNTNIITWEDVSRDVNSSFSTVESSIDKMVDGLRNIDVMIQKHSDTTQVTN